VKIENLTKTSKIHTCNVYLVTDDTHHKGKNTLVDVGKDPLVINKLRNISKNLNRKFRLDQVIITHDHYDHSYILPEIVKEFNPKVYAYSPIVRGIKAIEILKNNQYIKLGEKYFIASQAHAHSEDSIFLYSQAAGILFTGDVNFRLRIPTGEYSKKFLQNLKTISKQNVKTIFPGHGEPVFDNCNPILLRTLTNVTQSAIIA